ncbi:MAG: hypothetical protein M1826_000723 [Phylliscum demangeonii]|nr:MAG: hypothetical protein M1826_000723 [Phylliscum demangeonii]
MVRPLLPKDERKESPTTSDSAAEAKAAKRRCVSSACLPCRKRKSKCDGTVPHCSTCIAVYHTECHYELEAETAPRRKVALPKRTDRSPSPSTSRDRDPALATIVAAIATASGGEATEIVARIRSGERLDAIADSLKDHSVALLARTDSHSLEADFADIVGTHTINRSGETRYFGHTSSLGLVSTEDDPPVRHYVPAGSWTRVTADPGLIGHLLDLYFAWQHPFYVLFSKECLLHDMAQGRPKYCSPLLVNALLACACNYSDRPEARAHAHDPTTAGNHFFAEARRLLIEDERSSLTAVQALGLMSLRESSAGRDSSGYQYAGRCMRMALELGLHLCFAGVGANRLSPTEIEVRKITFWGAFTLDTVWSICIGRISQLPRTAINVKKPTLADAIEQKPWTAYVESDAGAAAAVVAAPAQTSHTHKLLHQFCFLSEIANDMIVMFYAPRERFTSKKLLDFYARYTQWHQALPSVLAITPDATPQVFCLHMYYHTVVLYLFRPFLKVDLVHSPVSPRAVCTTSAERISSLAEAYRGRYSLRRVCLLMTHCLLSSSTIHLLNLPAPGAARHLTHDLRHLQEMTANHAFAERCRRIVLLLAQKWQITLPAEADDARTRAALPHTPPSPSPALVPYGRVAEATDSGRTRRDSVDLLPSDDSPVSSIGGNLVDFFWTPFPHQGVPLQATLDPGPMDISAMLDVRSSNWEQYSRDGFKMANVTDLSLGGQGMTEEDWAQILR